MLTTTIFIALWFVVWTMPSSREMAASPISRDVYRLVSTPSNLLSEKGLARCCLSLFARGVRRIWQIILRAIARTHARVIQASRGTSPLPRYIYSTFLASGFAPALPSRGATLLYPADKEYRELVVLVQLVFLYDLEFAEDGCVASNGTASERVGEIEGGALVSYLVTHLMRFPCVLERIEAFRIGRL